MGKWVEYHNEGFHALVAYESSCVARALGDIERSRGENYRTEVITPLRESAEKLTEATPQAADIGQFLNKNPIFDLGLGVLSDYIIGESDRIDAALKTFREESGVDLLKRGYGYSFLLEAITRAQEKGLFVKGGGLEYMLNKGIHDFPDVFSEMTHANSS